MIRLRHSLVAVTFATVALLAGNALATPISQSRTVQNVDWCSVGVGGIGDVGTGTLDLNCVSGTVTAAYLVWHGINNSGTDAVYDNATIDFDGNSVTGVSLGDASTNCWGAGSSRGYEANVTSFVSGNGSYPISGLAAATGHDANGASLIVVFNDGDSLNNRDLVFFTGNDSNYIEGFPGEDDGWNAALAGINYGGGAAGMQVHVADGQSAGDGTLNLTTVNGAVAIPDTDALYDGLSVPNEGNGRIASVALWDVHDFDITGAFGAVTGSVTLNLSGMVGAGDCLGLAVALMDLEPGSAPPPPQPPPPPPSQEYVPIPTLSEFGLLLMVLVLSGVALLKIRKD